MRIFRAHYVERNSKLGTTSENTHVLFPKTDTNLQSATDMTLRLQEWLQQLPDYSTSGPHYETLLDGTQNVLIVHIILLMMLYNTINCILYHPLLLNISLLSEIDENDPRKVQRMMRHSTVQIMRHFEDLHTASASVTFLLSAAVNLLTECKGSPPEHEARYLRHFWACLYYLGLLQGIHVSAQTASSFLHSVARRSRARILEPLVRGTEDGLSVWASTHAPGSLLAPIIEPEADNRPRPESPEYSQTVPHPIYHQVGGEAAITGEQDSPMVVDRRRALSNNRACSTVFRWLES